jgi:hypothetical protein
MQRIVMAVAAERQHHRGARISNGYIARRIELPIIEISAAQSSTTLHLSACTT